MKQLFFQIEALKINPCKVILETEGIIVVNCSVRNMIDEVKLFWDKIMHAFVHDKRNDRQEATIIEKVNSIQTDLIK